MAPSCMAAEDPTFVTQALSCYPACVQKIIGPCLGQGACKIDYLGRGNGEALGSFTFANCVNHQFHNGILWGATGNVTKADADCYSYTYSTNTPEPRDFPTTVNSARGSFVLHLVGGRDVVECDGMSYPVNIAAGCNGIVLDRESLQYSVACK